MRNSFLPFFLLLLLLSLSVLGGCNRAGDITADLEEMSANVEKFEALVLAGDIDGIMGEFTDSIKPTGYYPYQPPLEGREALRAAWEGFFSQGKVTDFSSAKIHRKLYGDLAVVYGLWQMTQESENGSLTSSGRFTTVYGRKDGVWKIIHDHVSISPSEMNPGEGASTEAESGSASEA